MNNINHRVYFQSKDMQKKYEDSFTVNKKELLNNSSMLASTLVELSNKAVYQIFKTVNIDVEKLNNNGIICFNRDLELKFIEPLSSEGDISLVTEELAQNGYEFKFETNFFQADKCFCKIISAYDFRDSSNKQVSINSL